VTGEEWDFTAWANGEPNDQGNPTESFLEMYSIGLWNDVPEAGSGYAEFAYVVEVVPTPASIGLLGALPLFRRRQR
jgi:hypothetical protein